MDRRLRHFSGDGMAFSGLPDEEYDISVCWKRGKPGSEGWPDHYLWHLECADGTLCHCPDFFFRDTDATDWVKALTGYIRSEFVEVFQIQGGAV